MLCSIVHPLNHYPLQSLHPTSWGTLNILPTRLVLHIKSHKSFILATQLSIVVHVNVFLWRRRRTNSPFKGEGGGWAQRYKPYDTAQPSPRYGITTQGTDVSRGPHYVYIVYIYTTCKLYTLRSRCSRDHKQSSLRPYHLRGAV